MFELKDVQGGKVGSERGSKKLSTSPTYSLSTLYKTKQGEMFDMIAYRQMGDCMNTQELMRANRDKLDMFEFSAGVELNIPTVESSAEINLPPWKR